jgi:hypothetical protein
MKRAAALEMLLTSVENPKSYVGGIPISATVPTAVQSVYYNANIDMSVTPNLRSGGLLWNPAGGYDSIDLCASVDTKEPVTYEVDGPITIQGTPHWDLLPVLSPQAQLQKSPALSTTVTIGRVSAAKVCIFSSTISSTNASLSGLVHAVAFADLRDMKDTSAAALTTLGVTTKDTAVNVPASKGVQLVVGSDVQMDLHPISIRQAGVASENSVNAFVANSGTVAFIGVGFQFAPLTPDPSRFYHNVSDLLPNLPATLEVSINGSNAHNQTLTATSIWATYDEFSNKVSFMDGENMNLTYGQGTVGSDKKTIQFSAPGADYWIAGYKIQITNGDLEEMVLTQLGTFDPRHFGARRLAKWERIGSEQVLTIAGVGAVEGLMTGSIAQYVKANDRFISRIHTTDAWDLLCAAYNDPRVDGLRRVQVVSKIDSIAVARAIRAAEDDEGGALIPSSTVSLPDAQSVMQAGSRARAAGMYSTGRAAGMYAVPRGQAGGFFSSLGAGLGNIADAII